MRNFPPPANTAGRRTGDSLVVNWTRPPARHPGSRVGISCARWRRQSQSKDWSLTSLKEKLIKIGAKGSEPRPLCYPPDGRGRHRTTNVPRDFAAHRGATAAATTSASVRLSMSCINDNQREEWVRMPRHAAACYAGSRLYLGSSRDFQAVQKIATASPTFELSGESRSRRRFRERRRWFWREERRFPAANDRAGQGWTRSRMA